MLADLAPWGAVATIAVALIAAAVKLIQFFVKRYDDGVEARVRRKCPHWVPIFLPDGKIQVENLFTSPPGTLSWICSRCGIVTHDERMANLAVRQSVVEFMRKAGISGSVQWGHSTTERSS